MRVYLATAPFLTVSILMAQALPPQDRVHVFERKIAEAGAVAAVPADNLQFIATEFSFGDKAVTGAPYSAEAITETTQTLADGNKISRKNSAQLYRDSEGRTRRDQTIGHIGPWSTRSNFKSSIIHDPVAEQHYILEPETKTARKLPSVRLLTRPQVAGASGPAEPGVQIAFPPLARMPHPEITEDIRIEGPHVQIRRVGPGSGRPDGQAAVKNESLGTKVIEGLVAEGTRTTLTIKAGEIGNERPIDVVTERWYSPELKVVVMTQNSDPRMGETVYKLTNVQRSEPGRYLFEVPPDYTIKESNTRHPQVEVFKTTGPAPRD